MANTPGNPHLDGPVHADDLPELDETRRPGDERSTARASHPDQSPPPELQAASSTSGATTMQRVVALVLLFGLLATIGVSLFA